MLYLVATPIGNLEDFSPRGVRVLREAEIIACEDTRRTRKLLAHFGIPRPAVLLSYREGNEMRVGGRILGWLREGRTVALCSDSGYPGISDPGYRLVAAAVEEGLEMDVIPGPSAVPVALLLSGLPTAGYVFKGYPPRKPGKLRACFEQDAQTPHTMILFESPFRLAKMLAAAREVLGDRRAAVCFELTKAFQHVWRGGLSELAERAAAEPVKGEVTVVIEGRTRKSAGKGTGGDERNG